MVYHLLIRKIFRIMRHPRFKGLTTDTGIDSKSGIKQGLRSQPSKQMNQYFAQRGLLDILEKTPAMYTRRKSNSRYCILGDPKVARRIAYEIYPRLEGKYVMECDPGFGFMSEILVTVAPYLRLCEPNAEFRSRLQEFKSNFPGKVDVFDFNFHHLQIYSISREEFCLNKVAQFFESLPESSSTEINLTFICTMMKCGTVKLLCQKMACNEFFQKFGRWEYYWLIPNSEYEKLIASPENEFSNLYTDVAVLFQTMFDYEVLLDHLPRNIFLPWTEKKSEEYILLIKVVPKLQFLNIIQNEKLFANFVDFLRTNVRIRKRVINNLESYVSGCGPDFIFNFDLTSYTEFLELTPKKLLAMFLSLSKCPEFSSSKEGSSIINNYEDEINHESDLEDEEQDSCQNSERMDDDDERNYVFM